MLRELQARSIRVGKARVQRTMKLHGIRAKGKKKFVVTTDSKPTLPIAKNLLNRVFPAWLPMRCAWRGSVAGHHRDWCFTQTEAATIAAVNSKAR
jgi:putative transposase